jgi:hypothetical protein
MHHNNSSTPLASTVVASLWMSFGLDDALNTQSDEYKDEISQLAVDSLNYWQAIHKKLSNINI